MFEIALCTVCDDATKNSHIISIFIKLHYVDLHANAPPHKKNKKNITTSMTIT